MLLQKTIKNWFMVQCKHSEAVQFFEMATFKMINEALNLEFEHFTRIICSFLITMNHVWSLENSRWENHAANKEYISGTLQISSEIVKERSDRQNIWQDMVREKFSVKGLNAFFILFNYYKGKIKSLNILYIYRVTDLRPAQ